MFRRQTPDLICDCLVDKLPQYSREEVEDHMHWYVDHELHHHRKQELLSKYRQRMEELEQDAVEADEINLQDELRSKENLRLRFTTKHKVEIAKWKLKRAQDQEEADGKKQNLECEQAQLEKEKRKKEERKRENQKKKIEAAKEE